MSEFEQAWQTRKAERGNGCNPRTEFKAGWCAAIDSLEANRMPAGEVTSAAQTIPAGNDSGVSNPAPDAPTGQGARDYPLRAYLAKTLDNIEDETRSWTITDVRAFITGALEIADEVTR